MTRVAQVFGGETGIADAVDDDPLGPSMGPARVRAGLRVQPSIGRLLVFSSGPENMHEMLRVLAGTRIAVQMWFACEGQQPGWARPQREAWEAEHGWGGLEDRERQMPPPVAPQPREWPPPWAWRAAAAAPSR